MPLVTLAHQEDFDGWRDAARALAASEVPAGEVGWQVGEARQDLFAACDAGIGIGTTIRQCYRAAG